MADLGSAVDRFPRLSGSARIAYAVIPRDESAFHHAGVRTEFVQNICGGGVRFEVDERIARGAMLAIRIDLPNLSDAILALGRVLRCGIAELDETRREAAVELFWTGWEQPQVNAALHRLVSDAVD